MSNRRGATSVGLADTALPISLATSSFEAPDLIASSASASSACPFFESLANTASKRFLASSGFLSAISSPARLATAGKCIGSITSARSKLLLAPAISCFASNVRPRKFAANGLSGCFFSKPSIAFRALSSSRRLKCALISARSAVVPVSDAAISSNSPNAASTCPPIMRASARVVRLLRSSGACLLAFAKYSSAFLTSPLCKYTSPATVSSSGSTFSRFKPGSKAAIALDD